MTPVLWPGRRHVLGLLCLLALVAGATGLSRALRLREVGCYPPALTRLLETRAVARPIEARLACQSDHAPYQQRRRTGVGRGHGVSNVAASALVRELAANATTPQGEAALAVALLVTGDADQAVRIFEGSGIVADAPAWRVGLAAAYLAREAETADPLDAARAYEHAARLSGTPGPVAPAAAFNAALALERLSLTTAAARAWIDVSRDEPDGDWRAEAAERARALSTRVLGDQIAPRQRLMDALARRHDVVSVVREHPQVAREYFEDELLAAWGRSVLVRQAGEETRLRGAADELAAALSDSHRESAWAQLAAGLRTTVGPRRAALASAFVAYGEARQRYDADDILGATRRLDDALPALSRAHSPLLGWALVHKALVRYRASDLAGAHTAASDALAFAISSRMPTLQARVEWFLGFLAAARHDRERARSLWLRALARFEAVGEAENTATLHIQLAEVADTLGEMSVGWRHRRAALAARLALFTPRRRHAILMSAARSALQQGLPHLALRLNDEMQVNAGAWGAPGPVSQAHFYRARILAGLGKTREATSSLEHARLALRRVESPALSRANEAEFRTIESEVLAGIDATRARDAASSALSWFRENGVALRDDALYLARARAHLGLARREDAERDLLEGISGFERRLAAIADPAARVSAFDAGWDLYRVLAQLRLDRGDARGALLAADRGRAQELKRRLAADTTPDATTRIPTEAALVQYAWFPDRLVILTVVDSEVTATAVRDVAHLERLCWQYTWIMSGEGPAAYREQVLTRLYEVLVRPIEARIAGKPVLAIVADGALHRVSFATLVDGQGRYLGQRHVLVAAPSVEVFARQSAHRVPTSAVRRALVIGNPSRGEHDQTLPPLPGSEREAAAIGALYPDRHVLLGVDASRDRILRDLDTAHVLHFGGHAIANDAYPALSRLVTGPGAEGTGGILAFELERRSLPNLRVAVLAACRTGISGLAKGEGALGFARALMAAGVPTVVATLWDIDDEASTLLFTSVHRALRRGLDGPAAVQAAQLSLLTSTNPRHRDPAVWGAVIAAGALGAVSTMDAGQTQGKGKDRQWN